jgi:hypothetical protein
MSVMKIGGGGNSIGSNGIKAPCAAFAYLPTFSPFLSVIGRWFGEDVYTLGEWVGMDRFLVAPPRRPQHYRLYKIFF